MIAFATICIFLSSCLLVVWSAVPILLLYASRKREVVKRMKTVHGATTKDLEDVRHIAWSILGMTWIPFTMLNSSIILYMAVT